MSQIFEYLTIISLAISLIVFLVTLVQNYQYEKRIRGNYNLYFSLFLFLWISIELFNEYSRDESIILFQLFHMIIVLTLAIWLNKRFVWALRTAKKQSEGELNV